MDKYKVKLCGKEYIVDVAEFEDEQAMGLAGKPYLNTNEGMLFAYDQPVSTYFTMKDTEFDLTIVLLDNLLRVVGVYQAEALDTEPYYVEDVNAVLEIPARDDIKLDSFLQIQEVVSEDGDMVVLDQKGDVQMALKGNERILSRKHTQGLIKLVLGIKNAVKAGANEDDVYAMIGRYIFSVFDTQDHTKPEYVQQPNV